MCLAGQARGEDKDVWARWGLLLAIFLACTLMTSLIASASASSAEPAPPGPAPGQLFGFSGINQTGVPGPATSAALIAGIGGNASRTTIHWQALEPRPGVYDEARFDRYETLYAALRGAGITPIFVLEYAPDWARDPGTPQDCGASTSCHYPPSDEMLGEWRKFVAEIAKRFPAAAIEVWNEPNYIGQWQSGVDPARYARLLAEADAAAAEVSPKIPVYMGGLGTAKKSNSLAASDFLEKAYSATPSIKAHTDAINFHLYTGTDLSEGSTFDKIFTNMRAVRDAHGDDATPLLVSEMGATTTGPSAVTEAQQANVVLRTARRYWRCRIRSACSSTRWPIERRSRRPTLSAASG